MSNYKEKIVTFFIKDYPEIVHLASEDPIDLNAFPLGREDATDRLNLCPSTLKIDDTDFGTDPVNEIGIDGGRTSMDYFIDLFKVANALPGKTPDYVTVLKIWYAVNDTLQMTMLYQPLLMTKNKDVGTERSYDEIAGPFYVFDPMTGFVPAPGSYSSDQESYRNKIQIKHKNGQDVYTGLIKGTDAESAIFSFQEIFSLIYDNWNETKILNVYNVIVDVENDPKTDVRHSLLFAPYALGEIGFNGMCADLAHLCPPHCKISYQLEQF